MAGAVQRQHAAHRQFGDAAAPDFADPDGVIAACEALYRRQGQTPIFVPSILWLAGV
jgi:hypothetical protein